jgi:hypothetical protein
MLDELELLLEDRLDDEELERLEDEELLLDEGRGLLELDELDVLEELLGGLTGPGALLPQLVAGMPSPAAFPPAIVTPRAVSTGPMWFATPRLRAPRSAPQRMPTTRPALSTIAAPESP